MHYHGQILDVVRKSNGLCSKKDIQQQTGLAWGTMCKGVDALLARGSLTIGREAPVGRGRPIIPLSINPAAVCFLGIDIGASRTRLLLCDLNFQSLERQAVETPRYQGADLFFTWLFGLLDRFLPAGDARRACLGGIGLSVSGNVQSDTGILVSGGNFGLKLGANLPLTDQVSAHCGVPAYAVTTQAATVWAEYHFGSCAGCANLVTVGLGIGIGSGVVSNRHLLISQPGRPVGYIGHLLMSDNRRLCTCGYRGCLEAYAGGSFLAEVAAGELPDRPELHNAAALDQAAARADPAACRILATAARYNAAGVAGMIQLYSPEAVIFSGGQSRADGYLYNRTLAEIREILPEERRQHIRFVISGLGDHQAALGAARLAFEQFIA
jgi:predicted NBD/HSP70 family sugar kinase